MNSIAVPHIIDPTWFLLAHNKIPMIQEDYEDEEEEEGLDTTESVLIAPPRFNDDDETEVILMTNHND